MKLGMLSRQRTRDVLWDRIRSGCMPDKKETIWAKTHVAVWTATAPVRFEMRLRVYEELDRR